MKGQRILLSYVLKVLQPTLNTRRLHMLRKGIMISPEHIPYSSSVHTLVSVTALILPASSGKVLSGGGFYLPPGRRNHVAQEQETWRRIHTTVGPRFTNAPVH
jgi:hypothetical protein